MSYNGIALLDAFLTSPLFNPSPAQEGVSTPHARAKQHNNQYVVEIDLPGVSKENISVEALGRTVKIVGKVDTPTRKTVMERTFSVPRAVKATEGKAEYVNGVLTVAFPVAEPATPQKVSIPILPEGKSVLEVESANPTENTQENETTAVEK